MFGVLKALFGGNGGSESTDLRGRRGMPIYRGNGINNPEGEICERAIASNRFLGHGIDDSGMHVLSTVEGGNAYLMKVDIQRSPGLGDALILRGVYQTEPSRIAQMAADLGASEP